MTQRVISGNATKVAPSLSTIDSLGKKAGYHSRRGPRHPPISSIPLTPEYNSVKQLSITESSAESRASDARIPEPQFPSLLLSLCHVSSPLTAASHPYLPERRGAVSSSLRRAVKRFLLPELTLIRSPLPSRALCSVDPEWESSAYSPTNGEGNLHGRRHFVFRDTVRRYFGFPYLLRSVTLRFSRLSREFSHLLRVTLCLFR